MISTALAAGFDIVAGIVVLALIESAARAPLRQGRPRTSLARLGFGIGFVFLVVGRGELFTENFLVPLAGLDHRTGAPGANLAKLWLTSPLFNVLGGLSSS